MNSARLVSLNTTDSLLHSQTGILSVWAPFIYLHWSLRRTSPSKTGETGYLRVRARTQFPAFYIGMHFPLLAIPWEILRWGNTIEELEVLKSSYESLYHKPGCLWLSPNNWRVKEKTLRFELMCHVTKQRGPVLVKELVLMKEFIDYFSRG